MAAKSILKNVDIKDKKMGKSLVRALENAKGKHGKDIQLSRTYEDVREDKEYCRKKNTPVGEAQNED